MLTSPVLCVFLISCFTEKLHLSSCPHNCECYSAHNHFMPTSDRQTISLVCDNDPLNQPPGTFPDTKQMQTIADNYIINTLAFKNIDTRDIMPKHYLDSFVVSNLVFENSKLSELIVPIEPDNHNNNHLNNLDLKALTFRNCYFKSQFNVSFNWTVFHKLVYLEAIHVEGGLLPALDPTLVKIPAGNILTANFVSCQLCYVRPGYFERWVKLRRLTIAGNTIASLDWISTVMPGLWYLDVSSNKIYGILFDLTKLLPSLKVLKLDHNSIKVINYPDIIKPLLLSHTLTEFSFYGMTFCTDSSMIWTTQVLADTSITKFPMFFENSLMLTHCQEHETRDLPIGYEPKLCHNLAETSFRNTICKYSNSSHCIPS